MKKVIKYSLLIWLIIFSSCRKIEESPVLDSNPTIDSFRQPLSPYMGDQSSDFFVLNSWYAYDEGNHIIWPNFRVYALRVNSKYYKFQILDYYDERSYSGFFTIRIQPENEEPYLLDFAAEGCGNVYTNPDYQECINNPETNVYTYIDVEERSVKKLSSVRAKRDKKWDLAFNGTDLILNSGTSGPGNVRAANLYLYGGFFSGSKINFQRIAEESFGRRGEVYFSQKFDFRRAAFSLPKGQSRAIFETDWFRKKGEFFEAVSKNWWIIKGSEGTTYSKFNVKSISEEKIGEVIESKLTLRIFNQNETDTQFGEFQDWELPPFSSEKRLIKTCLDLNQLSIVKCSSNKADLILSISNKNGKRRWRFNVIQGAVGPLSVEEMLKWSRGF